MKMKRLLSLLTCAALMLALTPITARAESNPDNNIFDVSEGDITVSDAGGGNLTVTYGTPPVTTAPFPNANEITIIGSTTSNGIVVEGGVTAKITLNGVNIDLSSGGCAFEMQGTAAVALTLADGTGNNLKSYAPYAGLQVPVDAALTIGGTGTLTAEGIYDAVNGQGAGIGGGADSVSGSITITSGTVTATSIHGAGIGGGDNGNGGTVTINGGTVTATGGSGAGIGGGGSFGNGGTVEITGGTVTATGSSGAGIGGGGFGNGGTVEITGGTVTATSSRGAGIGGGEGGLGGGSGGTVTITGGTVTAISGEGAGIGGGFLGSGGSVYISGGSVKAISSNGSRQGIGPGGGGDPGSGTLKNKPEAQGGVDVFLTTVTLKDASGDAVANTAVTSFSASRGGAPYNYGITDMKTAADGKLYLYLPGGRADLQMSDGSYGYAASPTVDASGEAAVTANDLSSTNIVITEAGAYHLTQSDSAATTNTISVNGGSEADPINITVCGINIDASAANKCAFELQGTAAVALTLADGTGSSLTSYAPYAGLQVPENASLTIGGTGTLTAEGIYDAVNGQGAGIGGGGFGNGGTVEITGGTVTATSSSGAGIGGGEGGLGGGSGGTVTIIGGTVTAISSAGAGIGGGDGGDGGSVYISGGSVKAISSSGSRQGIGHGVGGDPDSGTLKNTVGGADVFLTTVTLSGVTEETAVASMTTDAGYTYGTNGMKTDADGILYLYLPENTTTTEARTAGTRYIGSIETLNGGAAGTLTADTDAPVVTGVTPSGTGVPVSGSLAITFNEEMRTNAGTVSLDGGATPLAGGSWNGGKTVYTVPYDGLANGTAYTVSITGFTDYSGNAMADATAAFTTVPGWGGYYEPVYKADDSSGGTLDVTVNLASGSASVTVGDTLGAGVRDGGNVTVTMPSIPGVTSYSLGILVAYLSTPGGGTLTFRTGTGSMTLPADMLAGIPGAEGKKAEITIAMGDKTGLSDDVKAAIGDRPLIELSLTLDGRQTDWNNPGSPVTVSIPYTPTAEELENPESIVVWYIDGGGNPVCIPNGRYDPLTGTVTFSTTHFSLFAAGYNNVRFGDVEAGVWYEKAVSFIAARGITGGTGGGNFSPDALLTRGEFIVMLMRAYGISPDINPTDNFSDAGGTYYTGYLAAAKRLGISSGVGDNMFAPDRTITRQEMFTLLYNALKAVGKLPDGAPGPALNDFLDAGSVADWAYDALAMLVETGVVSGSGGKLNPTGTATRAEMARTLFNLLG